MTTRREFRLINDLHEIPRLAEAVEALFESWGLPSKLAFSFNLSLDELLTNTITHSYAPGARHEIVVRFAREEDGAVTAEMIDDGLAYDPLTQAKPPVLHGTAEERPIGGLGVHFVKTLMDEARYERRDGHNHMLLRKRAEG